jgi:hypothetical protein
MPDMRDQLVAGYIGKESGVSQFLADKRNIVLLVSIILMLVFGWLWLAERPSSPNAVVVSVGDQQITQGDVIKEMQATHGNTVVSNMIENILMERYAADHQVTVSDSEVDQLQQFQVNTLDFANLSLDQYLANQGITAEEFRKQLREQALKIKLLVTPEEMKAAFPTISNIELAKNIKVFSLPPRYFYRRFRFPDLKTAQDAIATLESLSDPAQDTETVASVAANAVPPPLGEGPVSAKIQKDIPGLGADGNQGLDKLLGSLSPGKCTPPMPISVGNGITHYGVVELVQVKPATQPDFANEYMVVGQLLLQKGDQQTYGLRERQLESAMIGNTDIVFQSSQYDVAKKMFDDKKKMAPPTPGATSGPAQPVAPSGAGQ